MYKEKINFLNEKISSKSSSENNRYDVIQIKRKQDTAKANEEKDPEEVKENKYFYDIRSPRLNRNLEENPTHTNDNVNNNTNNNELLLIKKQNNTSIIKKESVIKKSVEVISKAFESAHNSKEKKPINLKLAMLDDFKLNPSSRFAHKASIESNKKLQSHKNSEAAIENNSIKENKTNVEKVKTSCCEKLSNYFRGDPNKTYAVKKKVWAGSGGVFDNEYQDNREYNHNMD
jgi:hypothetical protein